MKILVIDGQGGGLGRELVAAIRENFSDAEVTAVGTNSTATAAMLKAGAHNAATGENPVAVACRSADVIVGPVGIVIADSLVGEVTPAMAVAVGQSRARRILIPFNLCNNIIAGLSDVPAARLIQNVIAEIRKI